MTDLLQVGMKIQAIAGKNVFYYKGKENVRQDFQSIVEDFKRKKLTLQLILVVLPFKGGKAYNIIKKLGDLEHRIPTQCCVKKNLFKNGGVNGQVDIDNRITKNINYLFTFTFF